MSEYDYKYSRSEIIVRIIQTIVVIVAITLFLLAFFSVINLNPYKLGVSVLTFGLGSVGIVGESIENGYFSLPWSSVFLLSVGTVVLLIGALAWYFIVLIGVAMLAVGVFASLWLSAHLSPDWHEPTTIFDKKPNDWE